MQSFNPYLPLNEYIPDGEPHVFGDRVYVYGSHDLPGGRAYCEGDYAVWSAPLKDLKTWRSEGTSYYKTQDPSNAEGKMQLWAPDVTRGPDGRWYLYYCFSFYPEIGVAVGDSPAGPFSFYGHVRYPAHLNGGRELREFMPFDPAVLTDDDGRVYLYYGFAPACEKEMKLPKATPEELAAMSPEQRERFEKIRGIEFGENSMCVELEADMLTMKDTPHVLIPGGHHAAGTGFEGHAFFEASSIRKFDGRYYFVYSSHKSHELCYAVSDRPDGGFVYGGTIISNGDVGLNGRTSPVYPLGNNHGGIEKLGKDYYVFYHRQTNGTEFSRQGCAEKIEILPDGSIPQVEITSCGLNGGPLRSEGRYPASIACHLTDRDTLDYIDYSDPRYRSQVHVTQEGYEQHLTCIRDGAAIGYKYFDFSGAARRLLLEARGYFEGVLLAAHDPEGAAPIGELRLMLREGAWSIVEATITPQAGTRPLYLLAKGEGSFELRSLIFM